MWVVCYGAREKESPRCGGSQRPVAPQVRGGAGGVKVRAEAGFRTAFSAHCVQELWPGRPIIFLAFSNGGCYVYEFACRAAFYSHVYEVRMCSVGAPDVTEPCGPTW